jgi:hypothetical protein
MDLHWIGLYLYLTFSICWSHICDIAWIGHLHSIPHVPSMENPDADITMPGTLMHAPADVELNPDDEG